ncbi:hypothetical protein [Kordia zhangzhouensis]|uniref:hypothetical protein n=1 Tax=Kordia zhangzhouensis TaxID=1620405 RepID=UPI00062982DA|nr:hypothetical protein [Kordia zhangzhouensis]
MGKNEYIEFEMNNEDRFNDLTKLLDLISVSKKSGDYKSDKYWLDKFPNYTLKNYYFADSDLTPEIETFETKEETWHFYSMVEHLVENIDIEFLECKKIGNGKARLEFYSCGYPYGGITGLTMFLKSFDFKATEIDEGGGIYKVEWKNEMEFELKEIKTVDNNSYNLLWQKAKSMFNL